MLRNDSCAHSIQLTYISWKLGPIRYVDIRPAHINVQATRKLCSFKSYYFKTLNPSRYHVTHLCLWIYHVKRRAMRINKEILSYLPNTVFSEPCPSLFTESLLGYCGRPWLKYQSKTTNGSSRHRCWAAAHIRSTSLLILARQYQLTEKTTFSNRTW